MNDIIKSILPLLGTALGGPLGGIAAGFLGDKLGLEDKTIDSVKSILTGMSPEKLSELKVHDQEFQLKMAQLGYESAEKIEELNVRAAEAVNKSIQAEVASEHWPSYGWRPAIGFAVAFNVIASSLLVLMVFAAVVFGAKQAAEAVTQLPSVLGALAAITGTVMPILGIASYFRGKMQADPNILTNNKG